MKINKNHKGTPLDFFSKNYESSFWLVQLYESYNNLIFFKMMTHKKLALTKKMTHNFWEKFQGSTLGFLYVSDRGWPTVGGSPPLHGWWKYMQTTQLSELSRLRILSAPLEGWRPTKGGSQVLHIHTCVCDTYTHVYVAWHISVTHSVTHSVTGQG